MGVLDPPPIKRRFYHHKSTDVSVTAPGAVTIESGTFTIREKVLDIDAICRATFVAQGGAWGPVELLLGPTAAAPLNLRRQGVYQSNVAHTTLGAAWGFAGSVARERFSLDVTDIGMNVGDTMRYEFTAAVTGASLSLPLPESPVRAACAFGNPPSPANAMFGDKIIALRGTTRLMIVRYNAQASSFITCDFVGEVDIPSTTGGISISPDGRYVVCTNKTSNSVSVIDIEKMNHVTGSPFTMPDAASGPDGVAFISNTVAYIVGNTNGKVYPLTAATGTFGAPVALGGTTAPTRIKATPGATAVQAVCPGTNELVQITVATGAIAHRYACTGIKNVAPHPFLNKSYALASDGGIKVYIVDHGALTIDSGTLITTNHTASYVPEDGQVTSDGNALLIAQSATGTDNSWDQIVHLDTSQAGLQKFTEWRNDNGVSGRVGPVSIALSDFADICVPYTNALNIWPGGQFLCRPATYGGFEGEGLSLIVDGAST